MALKKGRQLRKRPEKENMKRTSVCAALCGILLAALLAGTGCSQAQTTPADQNKAEATAVAAGTAVSGTASTASEAAATGKTASETAAETAATVKSAPETASETATTGETASETAATGVTPGRIFSKPGDEKEYKGLVAIDPGHQQYGNPDQEPVGPGASSTKAKVSSGTSGVASGVPEYQLTLEIGLKLRDELVERGYKVMMCRETNEIDISNSERANLANDAGADAFVRIHANGCGDPGRSGAMTICQTPGNAYNADLYEKSRALADCILDAYVLSTGINYEYVWETDSMSGINWSQVPVTIVELGYMTNSEEDLNMQDSDMQEKMVDGIANGIDAYMVQYSQENEAEEKETGENEAEERETAENETKEAEENDTEEKEAAENDTEEKEAGKNDTEEKETAENETKENQEEEKEAAVNETGEEKDEK